MKYDFMIRPYVICIKNGFRKIEDVFPMDLREAVIEALALEGLGPDGKPLPKEPEKPIEEVEEPKDESEEPVEEPVEKPEEPVEEVEEEEPSKDTKEEDKSPVEEDKGAK